jgi:2-iminobutanoate/2-iminopropanoate deaminase
MSHRAIHTDAAPAALGPYSQATILPVGDRELIFMAGQIAVDPVTGAVLEGSVGEQVELVMSNLGAVLDAAGSSLAQVVKATIFLVSMDDFAAVNDVYGRYFSDVPPARATVAVRGLPKGVRVEIEAVAYR